MEEVRAERRRDEEEMDFERDREESVGERGTGSSESSWVTSRERVERAEGILNCAFSRKRGISSLTSC